MISESIRKVEISTANIQDQLAALLYATCKVDDDEEIGMIDLRELSKNVNGLITLNVPIKRREVQVIHHKNV